MAQLIIQPTEIANFYQLLQETYHEQSYPALAEPLEHYLILLLLRFIKKPEILNSIIAMDFLESAKQLSKANNWRMQNVGDKCLLFSGFFPELARKRRVTVSYFVKVGQTAYGALADINNRKADIAELYEALKNQFVAMMDILSAIRALSEKPDGLDLLEAEELWQKTGSKSAMQLLRGYTRGFFVRK